MKGLAELEIPVISDEIYADLSYEDSPKSFLSFSDNTIAIHGFSKYYAMTGWRLGFAAGNQELVQKLLTVKSNLDSGVPQAIQMMGIEALITYIVRHYIFHLYIYSIVLL